MIRLTRGNFDRRSEARQPSPSKECGMSRQLSGISLCSNPGSCSQYSGLYRIEVATAYQHYIRRPAGRASPQRGPNTGDAMERRGWKYGCNSLASRQGCYHQRRPRDDMVDHGSLDVSVASVAMGKEADLRRHTKKDLWSRQQLGRLEDRAGKGSTGQHGSFADHGSRVSTERSLKSCQPGADYIQRDVITISGFR